MRTLFAVLAAAAALATAPTALALPGDPPSEPLAPADGATLATDPDGVPVTFTCPLYRTSDAGDGFAAYGGARDHGVAFSTTNALGTDGRLQDPVALGTGEAVPGQDGQCASAFAAGGASPRPQETPGTYFWQVWRICAGCPTGYETGPVRSFTLRSAVAPKLALGPRVYATYATIATVTAAGAPNGTEALVQRRVGSQWRTVGRAPITSGQAEATVTLPRGTQAVRSVVQDRPSATTSIRVLPSTAKRTPVAQGRYRGSATFRVDGRTLRDLRASVPVLCAGATGPGGQLQTQLRTAFVRAIRLAPDGSFVAARADQGTAIRVRGRLAKGRLTQSTIELSVPGCSGSKKLTAVR